MIRTKDLGLLIKIIVFVCALYILLFSSLSRSQTRFVREYEFKSNLQYNTLVEMNLHIDF